MFVFPHSLVLLHLEQENRFVIGGLYIYRKQVLLWFGVKYHFADRYENCLNLLFSLSVPEVNSSSFPESIIPLYLLKEKYA